MNPQPDSIRGAVTACGQLSAVLHEKEQPYCLPRTMGLTMRSSSAVMSFGWLILMPLVFMSNIFADPSTMPVWLQKFISFNPLAWQLDAVRGLYKKER